MSPCNPPSKDKLKLIPDQASCKRLAHESQPWRRS